MVHTLDAKRRHKKCLHNVVRKRQSLTNLNTEQVSLVAETYYDYEGRESVNVLAVPATDASLTYRPGFNAFEALVSAVSTRTGGERQKFHYDNGRVENSILSDNTGAGSYYSPLTTANTIH